MRSFEGVPSAVSPGAAVRELPVTIGVAAVLVLFWLFGALVPWAPAQLALVPANTMMVHFHVWNVVTAGLYQSSLPKLVYAVAVVLLLGSRLEPAFGSQEFARFLFVVNLFNGVCTAAAFFGIYILWRSMVVLFVHISGADGIVVALLIAAVQQGGAEGTVPGVPSLRLQFLPFAFFGLQTLYWVIWEPAYYDLPFTWFGTLGGWYYLRFVRRGGGGAGGGGRPAAVAGDVSEHFAFANLFPGPLRRVIRPLADFLFGVARLAGFFRGRPSGAPEDEAFLLPSGHPGSAAAAMPQLGAAYVPGLAAPPPVQIEATAPPRAPLDPVAERRRKRAEEELEKRLAVLAGGDTSSDDDAT